MAESKQVPLIVDIDGRREVIGNATVYEDGSAICNITDVEFQGNFSGYVNGFSLGPKDNKEDTADGA